jgi:copper chaperone CopZ
MTETIHLTIEGMTCDHCLRAVRSRLQQTPGVEIEDVRIGSARIRLDEGLSSLEDVEEAIADEGYTAFRSDD